MDERIHSERTARSRAVTDSYKRLRKQLDEHPYQTLAMVAGVGFVLSGGLFTRFAVHVIANSLRLGAAAAFAPLIDSLLGDDADERTAETNGHGAAAT
jgi:hypothetical protein